ncbi:hypothetical protein D3C72_1996630 [compost metagenome]
MNGTTHSAKRAIFLMPPKITRPASTATTTPVVSLGTPKAPWVASAMELACTAPNTKPKAMIKHTEKIAAAQGAFRPLAI